MGLHPDPGRLKNLGHCVGRSTIARVLRAEGIPPGRQLPMTWQTFLQAHWPALVAATFSRQKCGPREAWSRTTWRSCWTCNRGVYTRSGARHIRTKRSSFNAYGRPRAKRDFCARDGFCSTIGTRSGAGVLSSGWPRPDLGGDFIRAEAGASSQSRSDLLGDDSPSQQQRARGITARGALRGLLGRDARRRTARNDSPGLGGFFAPYGKHPPCVAPWRVS
jgi:hypothetical protein